VSERAVQLRWGSATDTGRVRQNNEDTALATDTLFVVADGMGGHRGGEVASHLAVEVLGEQFAEPTVDSLLAAVVEANRAVYERALGDPDLRGMGTTLCVLAPVDEDGSDDDLVAVVNVGDSRAYLYRDGELTQLTEDHSLVAEMERDGRLTSEEAATHPQRNIVTRALGIDPEVDVDTFQVVPYEGDRFLLCSDGLFDMIDDDRIAATMRRLADPTDCAQELVRLANESGGRDNITVLVVDVVDDAGKAEAASAALAGEPSTATARTDVRARPAPVAEDELAQPAASTARRTKKERRRRFTWRVAIFLVVLVAIVGAAAGAVYWQARGTYYVGFAGDDVAIFRGKPDGVLWIDPTLEETTDLERREVPAARRGDVSEGKEFSSLGAARRYVDNLERAARPPTTTTTTTSTTSTTLPAPPTSPTSAP
jgi:PPM family protein phosphatase